MITQGLWRDYSGLNAVAGTIDGAGYRVSRDSLLNFRGLVGTAGLESATNGLRVSSTSRLTWIRVGLADASFL